MVARTTQTHTLQSEITELIPFLNYTQQNEGYNKEGLGHIFHQNCSSLSKLGLKVEVNRA